jgi:anaerobic carbon-monoxide dehydrogenase iron sulfur subunit
MKRVFIKEKACMGCHLCEVYCQVQHSKSKDLIKAFKRETPKPLPRVRMEVKGPVSFSVRCQHCPDAPCVQYCLTGALSQDPVTGVVLVDQDKCIGCWTCILACPYGAIRRDTEQGKAAKCDLCQGRAMPACVENCPNDALAYAEDVNR